MIRDASASSLIRYCMGTQSFSDHAELQHESDVTVSIRRCCRVVVLSSEAPVLRARSAPINYAKETAGGCLWCGQRCFGHTLCADSDRSRNAWEPVAGRLLSPSYGSEGWCPSDVMSYTVGFNSPM